jgi:hypothetical protein
VLRYQIDIFENIDPQPVLSHIFYGDTAQGVSAVIDAHRQTDSFLNAALTGKSFQGMRLRTQKYWLPSI